MLDLDLIGIDVEIVPQPALAPDRHIAQADGPVALVEEGLGDDAHRVGEIDEPRPGVTSLRRLLSQFENDRHGAQRLGQPSRPGGLLPETAVADRERLVDVAGRLPSDAQLDDDEVGALERGVTIRGGREGAAPAPVAQNAFGQAPHRFAAFLARVEQHEVVDDHSVLVVAQPVDELGGVRAPTPHDRHLYPHARQRTIRA